VRARIAALVVGLCVLVAAPTAAAPVVLETLVVPPGAGADFPVVTSRTALVAGRTYQLVASGVLRYTGDGVVEQHDALYCWESLGSTLPLGLCTPSSPLATANLVISFGGFTGALDLLDDDKRLPYASDHRYAVTFVARTAGRLSASVGSTNVPERAGVLTLEIVGEPDVPVSVASTSRPSPPVPRGAAQVFGSAATQVALVIAAICRGEPALTAVCPDLVRLLEVFVTARERALGRDVRPRAVVATRAAGACGAPCRRRAVARYDRALERAIAAAEGLADALGAFAAADSAAALLTSSGTAKAQAGALDEALSFLPGPAHALARVRRDAGARRTVGRAELRRGLSALRRDVTLPQSRAFLVRLGREAPRSVNVARLLGRPLPTAGLSAVHRSITLEEAYAVLGALLAAGELSPQAVIALAHGLAGAAAASLTDVVGLQDLLGAFFAQAREALPPEQAELLSLVAKGLALGG
jgi:hypothetical protein